MLKRGGKPSTVDEYIAAYPPATKKRLASIRKTIKTAAPNAEEVISYGIAGYKYRGMLIFFAAFEEHISIYPAPRSNEKFKKELAAYKGGKGTVQFPNDRPVPLDLVKRIVKHRLQENEQKYAAKKK